MPKLKNIILIRTQALAYHRNSIIIKIKSKIKQVENITTIKSHFSVVIYTTHHTVRWYQMLHNIHSQNKCHTSVNNNNNNKKTKKQNTKHSINSISKKTKLKNKN